MNEIKVEPYIPDEDYDNPAMVVDFYEFTMANCLFLHGFKDTTLVFDMFFRKNPDNQGYSISAGQRKLTRFLLDYHFNEQDIHSSRRVVERVEKRTLVADTDTGKELKRQIVDLEQLLEAYRNGIVAEKE